MHSKDRRQYQQIDDDFSITHIDTGHDCGLNSSILFHVFVDTAMRNSRDDAPVQIYNMNH